MRFIGYIKQGDLLIARGSVMDADGVDHADVIAKGMDGLRRDGVRNNSFISRPESDEDRTRLADFDALVARFGVLVGEAIVDRAARMETAIARGGVVDARPYRMVYAPRPGVSREQPMTATFEVMSDAEVADLDARMDIMFKRPRAA